MILQIAMKNDENLRDIIHLQKEYIFSLPLLFS